MAGWCERCGYDVPVQGAPCGQCWNAEADGEAVRSLIAYFDAAMRRSRDLVSWVEDPKIRERPGNGQHHPDPVVREASLAALAEFQAAHAAVSVLGQIDDARAADALREALGHPDRYVRKAVVRSLGWSGDERDAAAIARGFDDPEWLVREEVAPALSFIGGQQAADALVAQLPKVKPGPIAFRERPDIIAALAVLRDERALDAAREETYAYLDPDRKGNDRCVGRSYAWPVPTSASVYGRPRSTSWAPPTSGRATSSTAASATQWSR
jgi:hypothetical protein